jgi:LysM repeat protein
MIALIPGLTAAWDISAQGSPLQPPQDGFSQVLTSASQASTAPETGAAPSAPRYVVQAGDNLSVIAKKLGYDNPQILARANNLKDPDRLQIGQTLTLPENSPALQSLVRLVWRKKPQPNQPPPFLRSKRHPGRHRRQPRPEAAIGGGLLVRVPASRQINGQRPALRYVCRHRGS